MSERINGISPLDLSPTEKMIFAAKVNRVCALDANTFNPTIDMPLVAEIVDTLDSRIEVSSHNIKLTITNKDDSKDSQLMGRTDGGDFKIPIRGEKDEFHLHLGKESTIGIGEYIVKKIGNKKEYKLIFSHFMGYSMDFDPEIHNLPTTEINYRIGTKDIISINKWAPVVTWVWNFMIVTEKKVPVWSLSKNNIR